MHLDCANINDKNVRSHMEEYKSSNKDNGHNNCDRNASKNGNYERIVSKNNYSERNTIKNNNCKRNATNNNKGVEKNVCKQSNKHTRK